MAAIFLGDFYAAVKSSRPARALCMRDSTFNFWNLSPVTSGNEWRRVAQVVATSKYLVLNSVTFSFWRVARVARGIHARARAIGF